MSDSYFFQTGDRLHGPNSAYDRNLAYRAGYRAYSNGWVRVAQFPYASEARADWLAGWDAGQRAWEAYHPEGA